ncbi:hypothetical protein Kpol_242p2 [Vanderwaltozyma polyspora DSM 70294]|uniref:Oxidoreductase-like domain-containing protein n=1 Tax=Vanderwaltozyma polyspora (strain ATCC 22028 / DSM 70294 / BCRC 21397 / CBS 2163 / NBRC 10782 / NRRL Y-8283 / UCD 57-17) TaxID=436907 RepID=A7TTC2_VANPO|nr:uncharacterized protein Kpol_242p2 [Vanderwaltozyma polyspora DSM 70294]EDO14479.1 hypothetical protein Kpol_242p2 [Vanderwaltozyma polyspora DSM 70294]
MSMIRNFKYDRSIQKLGQLCNRRSFSVSFGRFMIFEGNSSEIQGTAEERMTKVFGGRLKGEAPVSTSRMLTGGYKVIAGIKVPSKPVAPDNCCMSGCVNCVWELYNDDVRFWRGKRKEAVKKITGTNEIWPTNWDPPLALLEMRNLPELLRKEKSSQLQDSLKSNVNTESLFPKRQSPLPASVLAAKKRHQLERLHSKEKKLYLEQDDGWNDIPVYIKVFSEFERQNKLKKQKKKLENLKQEITM